MKLHFTRKTWYFLLLAAAAAGMADGFAMLAGLDFSFLEMMSFGAAGLAVLFLAAEKAPATAQPGQKPHRAANPNSGRFFLCFVMLLASYLMFGSHMATRLTLFWPMLVLVEYQRGAPLLQQLRLLVFAEALQVVTLLAALAGQAAFRFWAVLFWILVCTARGWAMLVLYRQKSADDGE